MVEGVTVTAGNADEEKLEENCEDERSDMTD